MTAVAPPVAPLSRGSTTDSPADSNRPTAWRWGWDAWLLLATALILGALSPLSDSDLPMHLRTGAWILDQRALPVVEPFAWTRAGDPFYAYSWLAEVAYALAWRAGGAWGLSALHALLLAASVGAVLALARVAQWTTWATRLTAVIHLILWSAVQPATRPQLALAITVPLAWIAAEWLARDGRALRGALLACLAAAISVNTHLFFFATLVPVVRLLADERPSLRRISVFGAANVVGWLLTPYALALPALLRLNLGGNPLLGRTSPIMELESGFAFLTHAAIGTRILVALLLALPFVPSVAAWSHRARASYALAWLAGLGLFGIAIRGLLPWWLLTLPLVASAFADIPLPQLRLTMRVTVAAWVIGVVGLLPRVVRERFETPAGTLLPHIAERGVEPAAAALVCLMQALDSSPMPVGEGVVPASVRGATVFDLGSYLVWRVPRVTWSIDGRGIFPDSVARPEAYLRLLDGKVPDLPWRTADVLILPRGHATLASVDADDAWRPVWRPDNAPGVAELWLRRSSSLGAAWSGNDASRCAAVADSVDALRRPLRERESP